MAEMNPLRRMIEDMQVRNLSPDAALLRARRRQIRPAFQPASRPARAGGSPRLPDPPHDDRISWAGFNVAVCALRLYGITLGRTAMVDRIPYARKQRQLPVILTAEEVARFFAAVPSLKHRMALMTAYAAGLRVSEVVRLSLADTDTDTDTDTSGVLMRVKQGKGGHDRYISCCRRTCSWFCAFIGGKHARRTGDFRVRTKAGRSRRACCSGHAETLARPPSSATWLLSIR
jgi:integrase/recombinase XerD